MYYNCKCIVIYTTSSINWINSIYLYKLEYVPRTWVYFSEI